MTSSTVLGNDNYLYGVTGRVLHLNQPVSFLLEFIHLTLMGQQAVVLEVLWEINKRLKLQVCYVTGRDTICDLMSFCGIPQFKMFALKK